MHTFLTAYWENLVFINYEVDAAILLPYLPMGTELDLYNGKCLVSLVGFMFLNTKLRGIGFPFHRNFEEFNLRFYVRRNEGNSYKRGVVFIKEIVPRRMITFIAYQLYGEKYYYHRMKHSLKETDANLEVGYSFLINKKWNAIQVTVTKQKEHLLTGTEEEFITEHYYGYTRLANNNTSEYQVQHPRWNMHRVTDYKVDVDAVALYGEQWHPFLSAEPTSVFMADGSPVAIFTRNIIK
jgi:uncharacterized protein YqjF (DUF2071 family)